MAQTQTAGTITVIERERTKRGWTQGDIGSFVGSTYSAVSRWEGRDRKRRPNPQAIKILAKLFEIEEREIAEDYGAKAKHVRRYAAG